MPPVKVGALRAEGRDLSLRAVKKHSDGAVAEAGRDAVREKRHDLLRQGGGGDIPVVDGAAKQPVAHAAADIIRRKARAVQRFQDPVRLFCVHGGQPPSGAVIFRKTACVCGKNSI